MSEDGAEGLITFKTFDEFKSSIFFYFLTVSPADTIRPVVVGFKRMWDIYFSMLTQISFQRDIYLGECIYFL